MHEVKQDLDVVFIGNEEGLLHHAVGELGVRILFHLVFIQDYVVEIMLYKDSLNFHFCVI